MPKDGPSHMRDFLAASDPGLLKSQIQLEQTYTDAYVPDSVVRADGNLKLQIRCRAASAR